jgi:hypothetical protein
VKEGKFKVEPVLNNHVMKTCGGMEVKLQAFLNLGVDECEP